MADTSSVALTCPNCRRGATVFVTLWTSSEPRRSQTWTCPHCRDPIPADLPGKVVWVLARQAEDPPPTPKRSGR